MMELRSTGLISILSPVYNEELYISEMILSVQAQGYANWELVFVDDGSTDLTAGIIKDAAARDPRIRLVHSASKVGKATAFNLAFRACNGSIICLLAGDDRLPENSLARRAADLRDATGPAMATYKLKTFSPDRKYDGLVMPRGTSTSNSGGVLTMNRALAEEIFPIPESLPSEDIWIGYSAPHLARQRVERPDIVLEYRIHEGNSNPRQADFRTMDRRMAARHAAWALLAESHLGFTPSQRSELTALSRAEEARRQGAVIKILRQRELPWPTRLGLASMANPALFRLRQRFNRYLSGWRSQ